MTRQIVLALGVGLLFCQAWVSRDARADLNERLKKAELKQDYLMDTVEAMVTWNVDASNLIERINTDLKRLEESRETTVWDVVEEGGEK